MNIHNQFELPKASAKSQCRSSMCDLMIIYKIIFRKKRFIDDTDIENKILI